MHLVYLRDRGMVWLVDRAHSAEAAADMIPLIPCRHHLHSRRCSRKMKGRPRGGDRLWTLFGHRASPTATWFPRR